MASSGHPAHVLRVDWRYLQLLMAGLGLALLMWLGSVSYTVYYQYINSDALDKMATTQSQVQQLTQKNAQLVANKATLTQHYQAMLNRVNEVESKVRLLMRHDAPNGETQVHTVAKGMGGYAQPISADEAVVDFQQSAQLRIGRLESALNRILARPNGWPITDKAEITSHFGARTNPFGENSYEFHKGMDFAAPLGSSVQVTAPGVVVEAGLMGANGNLVVVEHGYGYRTAYAHLSKIMVVKGEQLKLGQVVGLLGSTGRSTGPHLHYAIYIDGTLVNPASFME